MPHIYRLDPAAQKYVDLAASLARDVLGKHAADVDAKSRYPKESIAAIAESGLFGLTLPTSVGGAGQGPRTFIAVVEELATGCASSAMIYVMHNSGAQAIASSSTLGGKEELLKSMAAGKHLTTLALSEKGSRSNFWAPVSKLASDGDGFSTNAYKSWVTAADHIDSAVSSAQKPGAASPLESTCYLFRSGQAGVHVVGAFEGLGLRGNDSAPVSIEGLHIPRADLVSDVGAGAKTMLEVILPWFAIGTAAMANGISRAALGATTAHLASTGLEHTGEKLRDLPILRARVAKMSVKMDQSRALLGYTASEMESPSASTPLYVLQCRLAALESVVEVTDLAMKACGGAAFSKHLPVERLFRDARAGWVMAPTVDHLEDFIGKALTGLPLF